ncbi:unnamed protein product [Ambrosiozyma monospora]|uniref:Unnamed protein product n=1 Tax=Ambrosiozyma monospora TaxID=43982 RepID=A0ACB5T8K6_AMBMO|nr:unnamed protein product [Ambrosiozyma monospora]
MSDIHGDDLDDGLDYAYSNSEDEGVAFNPEEEETRLPSEGEGDSDVETEVPQDGKKETESRTKENSKGNKNNKKRKNEASDNKLKNKKKQKMEYDINEKVNLAKQTPDIISEKLAAKIRSFNPDLSPLELSELYINKIVIKYTGDWDQERDLTNFAKFLQDTLPSVLPSGKPKKAKKPKKNKKGWAKENVSEPEPSDQRYSRWFTQGDQQEQIER